MSFRGADDENLDVPKGIVYVILNGGERYSVSSNGHKLL